MRKIITILVIMMMLFSTFAVLTVSNAADEEETVTWTDFSNAKYEIKKDGHNSASLEITGVTQNENSLYTAIITTDSNKPEIDENALVSSITVGTSYSIKYDTNSKAFTAIGDFSNEVELNKDLYLSIIETNSGKNKIVTYGNKLTRFNEPQYIDAFFSTFMTDSSDQIVMNYTHSSSNSRKMQIKVGKITDTTILQKIKDKNASGFADLLNYAKSNSSIYDQILNATTPSSSIAYDASSYSSNTNVINLQGLENEKYYYLYVRTDDENGKYTSNEAATLAKANVTSSGWDLFFYGDDRFKWADFGNIDSNTGKTDPTIAPTILPKTGINVIIITGVLGIAMVAVITKKKYNNYKDI